ncbi:hypothetical protein VTN00DRAFT_1580 [Thermoascus crustaceus]|uniref:uncharacterized protein n=1 Tax=Thermoascus crustaceus TaxID=5088 RepID=UPI003742EF32
MTGVSSSLPYSQGTSSPLWSLRHPANKLFLVALKLLTDLGWRDIADAYAREFPGTIRPCDRDCSTQWARQLRNDPNRVILESGQQLGAAESQDVARYLNLYAQNHLNQRGQAFMATGLATLPAQVPVLPFAHASAPAPAPATTLASLAPPIAPTLTPPSTTSAIATASAPAAALTTVSAPPTFTSALPPPISFFNAAPNPPQLPLQLPTSNIAFPQQPYGPGFGGSQSVVLRGNPFLGYDPADDESEEEDDYENHRTGFLSFFDALDHPGGDSR